MARGYSLDLRERVLTLMDEGMSRSAAARHLRIARSSAIKWIKRFKETGSIAEKLGAKKEPPAIEAHAEWLLG